MSKRYRHKLSRRGFLFLAVKESDFFPTLFLFFSGVQTKIRSVAVPSLCLVPQHHECTPFSGDRYVAYTTVCNVAYAVFMYDKVSGLLRHFCSGKLLCFRDWSDYDLVASDECDSVPIWRRSNSRITRTSCE